MSFARHEHEAYPDPIKAALARAGESVLAVITGTEGPSYRPLGAVMTIFADGQRIGTLSSGCIEADIALHALEVLEGGAPKSVRYGRGSPFQDIRLPCGGGLQILLIPRPDRAVLERVTASMRARTPCTLTIDPATGALALADAGATGWQGGLFRRRFLPEIRFLVFGKGPEAGTFSTLAQSAGYPTMLLSPDQETMAAAARAGCEVRHLKAASFPGDLAIDPYSAIVLFFHDHDWEPSILAPALDSPAFYIGAQGSQRSRDIRNLELEASGIAPEAIGRVRGPIGLVPSARDARTLAISVLAEVLAVAQQVVPGVGG